MLQPDVIQSLPSPAGPVLTVYLATDQAKQNNRGPKPGYLARLRSHAKVTVQTLPAEEQEAFRKQLQRIESYLEREPPRCRGAVIFAGRDRWEYVALPVEVEEEIQWGKPALAQMLWVLDEHKRYGVVVPDRKRARFFLHWLGELHEMEKKEFRVEVSKRKELGPVARVGVRISRGTNRDAFEHHVAAEYAHYDREIAERIRCWFAAERLECVFLVGLAEMVKAIRNKVAPTLKERVVLVEEDLSWASQTELLDRIGPTVASYKRKCELEVIEAMMGEAGRVVLGVDETLAQLQQGKIHSVVVAKGLNGSLQQCVRCSWADRTSDPACPACRGKRKNVALRDVLPELVRNYDAELEIVTGEGAARLQENGGIGAWLREFERKEYPASA